MQKRTFCCPRALFLFCITIAFFAVTFFPQRASAQINFGGRIAFLFPLCTIPPAFWITLGPPMVGLPLMFLPGSVFFAAGPPTHPGQALLGKAGTAWVPCIILVPTPFGPIPVVVGGGLPILFTGSSAI